MLRKMFEISRMQENSWPIFVRNSKLFEEVGEFSEALLHKEGFLPHKTMKEPLIGEAADIINCVVDVLSAAYTEYTIDEVMIELERHMAIKSQKWKMNIQSMK